MAAAIGDGCGLWSFPQHFLPKNLIREVMSWLILVRSSGLPSLLNKHDGDLHCVPIVIFAVWWFLCEHCYMTKGLLELRCLFYAHSEA